MDKETPPEHQKGISIGSSQAPKKKKKKIATCEPNLNAQNTPEIFLSLGGGLRNTTLKITGQNSI